MEQMDVGGDDDEAASIAARSDLDAGNFCFVEDVSAQSNDMSSQQAPFVPVCSSDETRSPDEPFGTSFDPEQGDLLAERYVLIEKLGFGGFGEVWRAHDQVLPGHTVAIKLLHRYHADKPEAVIRFEREAEVLGLLHHEHVVRKLAHGQDRGRRYLILEFIDGQTLRVILEGYRAAQAPPTLAWIRDIFDQICDAVTAMHTVREVGPIVHRDLKPENIMITGQFQEKPLVKILDLGLARLGDRGLTQIGSTAGTQHYMAPEQALGRVDDIVPSTDVFVLAVLLIEMLTLPNKATAQSPWWPLAEQGAHHLRRRLRALRLPVPDAMLDVLAASLDAEPSRRPRNAGTLHAQLECTWPREGAFEYGNALASRLQRRPFLRRQTLPCGRRNIARPSHTTLPARK